MAQRHLKAVPACASMTARRAVAYLRVSALMGRGGDDFHSPELQLGAIRRAMEVGDLTEVDVIDDDIDQTGRTFDREGIAKIKHLVEGGHIDAVVFYDIKRFGRNTYEGLGFAKWLNERGVRLVSASEQIDTSTPAGRWMFTSMLAMAEHQSDEIGRYWSGVIQKRARSGLTQRAPRGYRRVDGKDVPDPVLGPVFAEMFERYAKGERSRDICAMIFARTGVAFRSDHLKRALRKPFYRGLVPLNGELYPGQHEPLVDAQTWRRVEDRLAREHGVAPAVKAYKWSLAGLIFCPQDHPVQSNGSTKRSAIPGNVSLICGRRSQMGAQLAECPGIGSPSSAPVINVVLERVEIYMRELRLNVEAQSNAVIGRASAGAQIAALNGQLAKVRAAMTKLTVERAMWDTPDEIYRASMAELKANEAAIAQALRDSEQASTVRPPLETASLAQAMLDDWGEMTDPERNRALSGLVRRIVIRGKARPREPLDDRIEIDWL